MFNSDESDEKASANEKSSSGGVESRSTTSSVNSIVQYRQSSGGETAAPVYANYKKGYKGDHPYLNFCELFPPREDAYTDDATWLEAFRRMSIPRGIGIRVYVCVASAAVIWQNILRVAYGAAHEINGRQDYTGQLPLQCTSCIEGLFYGVLAVIRKHMAEGDGRILVIHVTTKASWSNLLFYASKSKKVWRDLIWTPLRQVLADNENIIIEWNKPHYLMESAERLARLGAVKRWCAEI